ncbi:MAG: cupredoxin domain-containing protein [Solirubrobacteraceae bacterium]
MRRLRTAFSALAAGLLLGMAGCGGSRHLTSATSLTRATATVTPSVRPAAPSGPLATTTTATPANLTPGTSVARIPASFELSATGSLSPATVSSPAFITIQLTVISRDSRPHQIVLRTPMQRTLLVPAGSSASILVGGLRAGTYPIDVDGSRRAALLIGGEPGP